MTPLVKSILLYLMMVGLVAISIAALPVSQIYIYLVYIIIIIVVYYYNDGILWGKRSLPGVLLGSFMMAVVFSGEIAAGWVEVGGFDFKPVELLLFLVLQFLVAIGEELSFRGYILKNLMDYSGRKMGIFLSSFMFSAIHIPSVVYYGLDSLRSITALVVVGMLGAILALLCLEYGLLSAIGFHFSWNFLQYNIFTLNQAQPGLILSRVLEPNILTGGSYGPEAGILGFVLAFLTLAILIRKHSKSLN